MATERLSKLQKQILEIYQEEARKLNNKKSRIGITRKEIARRLHLINYKTGKVYQMPRLNKTNADREAFAEMIEKIPLIADAESRFFAGKISKKTRDKTVNLINDSFSPEAKDTMDNLKVMTEERKKYAKGQVSLTRSLKSLVDKGYFSPPNPYPKWIDRIGSETKYQRLAYFITPKGLEAKTNLNYLYGKKIRE